MKINTAVRNIAAVLAGAVVGSVVNMSIIMISGYIIPPPDGADVTTTEGLKEAMHLFEPKHFLFPFLAHALGTFAGAILTVLIAVSHKIKLAFIIGFLFLAGGIANVLMLPSPLWFTITDLVVAYLPMAYLGGIIATKALIKN